MHKMRGSRRSREIYTKDKRRGREETLGRAEE